jgi:hypothetical protein
VLALALVLVMELSLKRLGGRVPDCGRAVRGRTMTEYVGEECVAIDSAERASEGIE